MRILHLLDSLDASDAARQVRLLGPALTRDAAAIDVCCLGCDSAGTAALREAGVPVHALGWTRWIDPGILWKLRALVRDLRPGVIHAWSLPALRTLAVCSPESLPRTVVSAAAAAPAWYDRWLLRQVRTIDGPLAVAAPAPSEPTPSAGLTIACLGPLERDAGVHQAIWAFDILRYLFDDLRLHIAGVGSQEESLRSMAVGLQSEAVHFLGDRADTAAVLRSADLVWIPSIADCGRLTALEAMTHGKAVIASNVPSLAELIRDGETGLLVPPGNVVALARRSRLLVDDAGLRQRLGAAARESALLRFPLDAAVRLWREIYREVGAPLAA